ncbi:MAG: hypothetical protein WCC21_07585 [Candidatus Acidiferrales bacterium]
MLTKYGVGIVSAGCSGHPRTGEDVSGVLFDGYQLIGGGGVPEKAPSLSDSTPNTSKHPSFTFELLEHARIQRLQ